MQSAEKKSTKPENKEAAPKLLTGSDVVKLLDEVMDGEKHTEAAVKNTFEMFTITL